MKNKHPHPWILFSISIALSLTAGAGAYTHLLDVTLTGPLGAISLLALFLAFNS